MATLLLTGPQRAGKTTILRIVQEKPIPKEYDSGTPPTHTEKAYRIAVPGLFVKAWWYSSDNVRDTAGALALTGDKDEMDKLIKKDSFIGYVFDVAKFWKELDDSCEQSGETAAAIRFFWNIWDKHKGKKPLFFIGTHVDKIVGENANEKEIAELKRKIIDKLKRANDEYQRIAGAGVFRYPYADIFFNSSCFRCIDATSSKQVNRLLDEIFKTKKSTL